jgi:hypothetical protein
VSRSGSGGRWLAGTTAGVGVVAVLCCAALPAIVALLGGIALTAILGLAGAVLVAVALIAGGMRVVRARRRRACAPTARRSAP